MINLITTWIHERTLSAEPLEIFTTPTRNRTLIKWSPGNGHAYTACFMDFSAIEAERTGVAEGEITCIVWNDDPESPRQWVGSIERQGNYTESDIRKIFGVQGHRLTALTAMIHLVLPGYDKKIGEEKARKLINDKKTKA